MEDHIISEIATDRHLSLRHMGSRLAYRSSMIMAKLFKPLGVNFSMSKTVTEMLLT